MTRTMLLTLALLAIGCAAPAMAQQAPPPCESERKK